MDDAVVRLAKGWFGYGQWDAKYWFVGMEPGGEELSANLKMWKALHFTPLVDIPGYPQSGDADRFSDKSNHQFTWSRLIWLLLAFKGEDATPNKTLDYQRRILGRADGETALIELSAISTPSSNTEEARRSWFRDERIVEIREVSRATAAASW